MYVEREEREGSNVLFSSIMINYFFPSTHSSTFIIYLFPSCVGVKLPLQQDIKN